MDEIEVLTASPAPSPAVREIDRGQDVLDALPMLSDDVTDVTAVHASNGMGLDVTADAAGDVTDVAESPIPDENGRPCYRVFDRPVKVGGQKYRAGVWYFGIEATKPGLAPKLTEHWLCSPLYVEAVTSDGQGNNFGRLLRFRNTLGQWRMWAMPMDMLRGSGEELRGELLAMGVLIDPRHRHQLGQYLQALTPKQRMRCALSVGWCGDNYVLPDEVIGPSAGSVIFQSGERDHEFKTGGTMLGWRDEIAARAVSNWALVFAISASFAGPILARCHQDGGGIHYVGDSSTGKTTILEGATATWGGPDFRRSWRATANGMEGAAALSNDCLLVLDEISEADSREVGPIIYALGNGRGKQRATRTGGARGVARWRCMVLSSGERTIATTMAEGGHRAKAGQSVRMLDTPVGGRFGAWDELHGMDSGPAFSDALKKAAATHYGHAGRAFLRRLTRDSRDLAAMLERIKALPEFAADDNEGQTRRAAARFALVALAGELATEYRITGWPEGEAIRGAAAAFRAWRAARGRGRDERRQVLEAVADFIERHGDSRFSSVATADGSHDPRVINRAGYWRDGMDGQRVYLFTSPGLKDAVTGFELKRALDILEQAGALPPAGASGERARPERIGGRPQRVYAIRPDKLRDPDGA